MESNRQLLNRCGTVALIKAAKQKKYTMALWTNGKDNYRITKRVGVFVYLHCDALGACQLPGLSLKYNIGEFLKEFKVVGILDKEIEEAKKVLRECKEWPVGKEFAQRTGILHGLERAQAKIRSKGI